MKKKKLKKPVQTSRMKAQRSLEKAHFNKRQEATLAAVEIEEPVTQLVASPVETALIREMRLYKRIAVFNTIILWIFVIAFLFLFLNYESVLRSVS